ncbi:37S ribosomal protein S22 [Trapelia coarctata]|nr:37S ribosomal protein S22 [Trapelia coarctata]
MEAIVRKARQTFGETLPASFLSPQEFGIYERLYGPPLRETNPEDVGLLQPMEEFGEEEEEGAAHTLLRENADGDLEEVEYDAEISVEECEAEGLKNPVEDKEAQEEFRARMMLYQDMAVSREPVIQQRETAAAEREQVSITDERNLETSSELVDEYEEQDDFEDAEDDFEDNQALRAHPLTIAGRFSTWPTTLQLPKEGFVDPVSAMLAGLPNKHLIEGAHRTFGGPGLPNSTATPTSKAHLQQQPIALEAFQSRMSDIEADVYMAAIWPGAYAAVMSTIVETRRRLGSSWLDDLLNKPGGPRILDAGAGGAAVFAWREVLQAEWERMHPDGLPEDTHIAFGKSTVVTGSPELRRRASRLLGNTTFLPRLPDYHPPRDLPVPPEGESSSRKQYDIVVAPYTLWTLKEDHMRKAQVQNFWSLLNPNGGVLIVIEKGVPRGFELVAGARETLLKNQISSPGSVEKLNELQDSSESRYTKKDDGMIIAPCTNHAQCPMYRISGAIKGRKDHCHFSQRFIRPPYLQHILGAKDRNHEDIRFSYIAVQRGKDLRKIEGIEQSEAATVAAFTGYHEYDDAEPAPPAEAPETDDDIAEPHMLSLPRSIMPPLKRHNHVTLDLCTPSGQLERWTVPKSFGKQAFRDARKAKWGDLWALGAKTRVVRQARIGTSKNKPKARRVFQVDVGAHESQDTIREVSDKGGQYKERYKRDKKGTKLTRPQKLRDVDR